MLVLVDARPCAVAAEPPDVPPLGLEIAGAVALIAAETLVATCARSRLRSPWVWSIWWVSWWGVGAGSGDRGVEHARV